MIFHNILSIHCQFSSFKMCWISEVKWNEGSSMHLQLYWELYYCGLEILSCMSNNYNVYSWLLHCLWPSLLRPCLCIYVYRAYVVVAVNTYIFCAARVVHTDMLYTLVNALYTFWFCTCTLWIWFSIWITSISTLIWWWR